jgi:hypothetical protein
MRRTLGTLLTAGAVALATACGSTSSSVATDPGFPSSSNPNSPGAGPVPGAHVTLVSMTGGGGRVSTEATLLDTATQVRAFTQQFGQPSTRSRVTQAVAKAGASGMAVYGAVVTIGCDRPPGADLMLDGLGRVVITPREVASPLPECLAAVTTVAIASVPGAD